MRILIIEDEELAAQRLERLLRKLDPSVEIAGRISSLHQGRRQLYGIFAAGIDVIFADIQLGDGLSFELLENCGIRIPVIFTTAYDEYALRAFKASGIEYLLKPFGEKELSAALAKYRGFFPADSGMPAGILLLKNLLEANGSVHFPNFISYRREKMVPVDSRTVECFQVSEQATYAYSEGNKWPLEETLNSLQAKLPPHYFFRANRQFLIHRSYIASIEPYFGGKLIVNLSQKSMGKIIVSKENSSKFRHWLEQ